MNVVHIQLWYFGFPPVVKGCHVCWSKVDANLSKVVKGFRKVDKGRNGRRANDRRRGWMSICEHLATFSDAYDMGCTFSDGCWTSLFQHFVCPLLSLCNLFNGYSNGVWNVQNFVFMSYVHELKGTRLQSHNSYADFRPSHLKGKYFCWKSKSLVKDSSIWTTSVSIYCNNNFIELSSWAIVIITTALISSLVICKNKHLFENRATCQTLDTFRILKC